MMLMAIENVLDIFNTCICSTYFSTMSYVVSNFDLPLKLSRAGTEIPLFSLSISFIFLGFEAFYLPFSFLYLLIF